LTQNPDIFLCASNQSRILGAKETGMCSSLQARYVVQIFWSHTQDGAYTTSTIIFPLEKTKASTTQVNR
jgi:hypothetical protein